MARTTGCGLCFDAPGNGLERMCLVHRWVQRIASLVGALIVTAAAINPSAASTTGSVSVTGSIVAAPVSISIGQTSIGFGGIDAKGTPQTGPTQAVGFEDAGGGARWFTTATVTVTVSSPTAWSGTVCMSASEGLPSGMLGLSAPPSPTDGSSALSRWSDAIKPAQGCLTQTTWIQSGLKTNGTDYVYHLATYVGLDDLPRNFSATVQFSASNTPS
jgi:hypothetical protein